MPSESCNRSVGAENIQMEDGVISASDTTTLLARAAQGDVLATDELFPLVYAELRQLAAQFLAHEGVAHTLQPTALVNEAYLRLVGSENGGWENRRHFFGAAAKAIRRILTDHARSKGRIKRGGGQHRVDLDGLDVAEQDASVDLIALDEALVKLAAQDAQKAKLVELKFFGGLPMEEIASALGVSESTAAREWRFVRAWLHREMAAAA